MAGAGNRTGILSGFADLFNPDEPDIRAKRVVFDPQVDQRTNRLLGDWNRNRRQWTSIYSNWLTDFNAQTPEITSNVNKENDFMKWIRDGGLESTLSGIRAEERTADETHRRQALDFADNQASRAGIFSGGNPGSSSADYARRLASGNRLLADFAGRDTARQRGDLGTVVNMKLATAGRINDNLTRLLNRQLQPQQLSDSELMSMINSLGQISNIRNNVSQPVFWREKSSSEKVGDVLDTFADGYFKGMSAYTGMAGMGGGGAPKQDQEPPPGDYVNNRQPTTSGMSYDGYKSGPVAQPTYQPSMSYGGGYYDGRNQSWDWKGF